MTEADREFTATERCREALAADRRPTRKDWSHFFRESLGVSRSLAERWAAALIQAGIADGRPDARLNRAAEQLRALARRLKP